MSPFVILYLVVSLAALATGWLKGGHPERLGVVFWLVGWMLAVPFNDLRIGDLRWAVALLDLASLCAFLWLALRFERWWPLGVSACLVLMMVVHLSAALIPEMTPLGEASAQLGLGMLAVLIQAAGAFERWLAGEAPASATAVWRQRQRTT
ncbi:MAG: hypothetical protein Q7U72_02390 [Brevundimonas sp.]|uniref:hypothetical protein n=1 Tax=Brevundimonas sp. TaxID=1871086 RepID=UPI002725EAE9|nr:hypothetical protein [Brevundimonas sp.]MDO9076279.1 hypothetical protein [Brevundimonas sp.]MDP3081008.1 hypothetical protein [Brevundimonas sp.]MDZ4060085.1 hypothetical protein [Brevundimonas sp.]